MKIIQILFILLIGSAFLCGQEKNFITTNFSYTFFGTGDLPGSSIGLNYSHFFSSKFGFRGGLVKSTGTGAGFFRRNEENNLVNVEIYGNSAPVSTLAIYQSYNLGLVYQLSEGRRQTLLASVGLNYKTSKHNRVGSSLNTASSNNNGRSVEILSYQYWANNEWGYFIHFDYLYFVNEDIALGLHLSTEPSDNIISHAGVSLGYRF